MRLPTLILCLTLAACGRGNEQSAADRQPPEIVLGPEDTAVVVQGPIAAGPALSGTLTATEEATLRAQLGGTVLEAGAEPGERVDAGQVLARLGVAHHVLAPLDLVMSRPTAGTPL